jgi:hypothetical protein
MSSSPAPRKKSATTDQPQAASVPTEISVSIVAAPWRAFSAAARWNVQPPQRTTGVASWSESHCQPSNWSWGTIASARTGSVRTAETKSRVRSAATGSFGSATEPSSLGSAARYPAASTAATSCSGATAAASNSTVARSVA